ncbi:phospholipid methyltransferase-domain-containing protein [Xylogone sp. PMI_703]|nr:phospholipid methyltransferase-domain-containing protein [Xylogone sp. PMI_703]
MVIPNMNQVLSQIDWSQRSLQYSAISIAFNPMFWNIVIRTEYNTRFLTKLFHSKYTGCYVLGFTEFSLANLRDYLFIRAVWCPQQPAQLVPDNRLYYIFPAFLFLFGNVLLLSSMFRLGVTGTYHGDYFGIHKEEKVTQFPYNITSAPMYWGKCISMLGFALWYGKLVGIVLSAEAVLAFRLSLFLEDPFTDRIYTNREKSAKDKE